MFNDHLVLQLRTALPHEFCDPATLRLSSARTAQTEISMAAAVVAAAFRESYT